MKRTYNGLYNAAWLSIIIAIVAGAGLFVIGYIKSTSINGVANNLMTQMRGSLGDILSGTIGVCLSFAATLFMIVTFREQQKQHLEQVQQQTRERFENTFFNLLSMFFEVRTMTEKHIIRDTQGKMSSLQDYYNGFSKFYEVRRKISTQKLVDQMLSHSEPCCEAELEQAEDCIGELFADFAHQTGCSIGYYYRYIHNILNFVLNQWNGDENRNIRKQYLNMVQAQMSDEELGLVFYDAMSPYGLNQHLIKEFKKNLDDEGFLENIRENTLLNRNHHKIYTSTMFKFLNLEEKKLKRNKIAGSTDTIADCDVP